LSGETRHTPSAFFAGTAEPAPGKVNRQFGWVEAGGEVQRSVPEVAEATEAMEWLEREPLGYGAEPVRFLCG